MNPERPEDKLKRILAKYPIRNPVWNAGVESVVTDASDLQIPDWHVSERPIAGEWPILDPWNRKFLKNAEVIRDQEGDVTCWRYVVTVEGEPVTCVIFND